jgi:hypothetical protein
LKLWISKTEKKWNNQETNESTNDKGSTRPTTSEYKTRRY